MNTFISKFNLTSEGASIIVSVTRVIKASLNIIEKIAIDHCCDWRFYLQIRDEHNVIHFVYYEVLT